MSAADLATLQAMRATLIEGLAHGVAEVTDQNGERIRYRSVREIQAALATINAEIRALQSGASSVILPTTSKGLDQ